MPSWPPNFARPSGWNVYISKRFGQLSATALQHSYPDEGSQGIKCRKWTLQSISVPPAGQGRTNLNVSAPWTNVSEFAVQVFFDYARLHTAFRTIPPKLCATKIMGLRSVCSHFSTSFRTNLPRVIPWYALSEKSNRLPEIDHGPKDTAAI